jgi:hypothetical protein
VRPGVEHGDALRGVGSYASAFNTSHLTVALRPVADGRRVVLSWGFGCAPASRVPARLPGNLGVRMTSLRGYLDSTKGAVQMALPPPCSPDLNPVEYLWASLKCHALANFCLKSLAELKTTARSKLRSGPRRQSIITACWKQAVL